jgi:murein DD-endopeptidase MepM/ murein hydrolase activator NlpD
MNAPSIRRAFTLTLILGLIAFAVPALSQTAVQQHRQARKESVRELRRQRIQHQRSVRQLRHAISHSRMLLGLQAKTDPGRWSRIQSWAVDQLHRTQWQLRGESRSWHRRSTRLRHRVRVHSAWLARYGLFEVCPVPGYSVIHDDFGEMVRVDGVEPHVHMGSDVEAPYGSRIVAPFDGRAEASWSKLGGLQVRVYGARGYVFNAHLSRYGRLGSVRAGDTIGYVGSTGDSTAPHDHIEWHPGDGGAVDPYMYLALSCIG